MELRFSTIETADGLKVSGKAICFDSPALIGHRYEVIKPCAVEGIDFSGISLLYNHAQDKIPLARTPDTMTIEVKPDGVYFSAVLPDTQTGHEVFEAIKRHDLSGMSFAFDVERDFFDETTKTRTITKFQKIYELSIVTTPAYAGTKIETRKKGDLYNMKEDILSSTEYRNAFYKSILGKPLSGPETAAYETGLAETRSAITSSTAAAVIPTQTLDDILSTRGKANFLSHCKKFSVPAKIAIPVCTPLTRAAWHVEGAEIEDADLTSASVVFDGYELTKLISLSHKAASMSISNFESYLTRELKESIADAMEYAAIQGTGENEPTGILSAINWTNDNMITADGSISFDDFVSAFALLQPGYDTDVSILCNSKTFYTHIVSLRDGIGRPFYFTDTQTGSVKSILGADIIISSAMPDATVIIGNFKKYLGYNFSEPVRVEVSRESSFRRNLIDMKATCTADVKCLDTAAFVKIIAVES